MHSGEFPETGRICFLDGEVWVDMSMEQLYTHNQVKGYVVTRQQAGGWVKSAVFGKSFRLTRQTDEPGQPEYTVEIR